MSDNEIAIQLYELKCRVDELENELNELKQLSANSKRFKKPTVDEITDYCNERNNNVDPQKFYDYYESNGWKIGKVAMKNWQAAVRTWEKNSYTKTSGSNNRPQGNVFRDMEDL